ncbi:hypothetical protein [Phytohabitans kaempferiae]|uniref:Excalibur calcium-binding domain-containing protein n=1 Tax=Phytohabitans kaempferiae TaxID=1620943 RepID=A0ABV6MCV5_9ACTN
MSQRFQAVIAWLRSRDRRQRWIVGGALAAVLLATGGWLVVGGGADGSPVWFGGRPEQTTTEPDSDAAGDQTVPDRVAGGKQDQAGSAASAPPRIHQFADKPGAPQRPLPSPTAPIEIDEGNEGCDYAYGDRTVCVPWEFPEGVTDGCAWLRERGYEPLKVNGRDRHNLDRNGDGTACGDGD